MNENEVFRLKGRIAISNLSREDKDMINSILDGVNKKDEDEKGYVYTVRVKLNNGSLAHATLFFKSNTGPTFEEGNYIPLYTFPWYYFLMLIHLDKRLKSNMSIFSPYLI